MYEIRKEATFEAAHCIEGHKDPLTGGPGKCSRPHGHSYTVAIVVQTKALQKVGFVLDYYWLGAFLKQYVVEQYDHQDLNELLQFKNCIKIDGVYRCLPTTAENIAEVIYKDWIGFFQSRSAEMGLPLGELYLSYIEVRETATTYARYGALVDHQTSSMNKSLCNLIQDLRARVSDLEGKS